MKKITPWKNENITARFDEFPAFMNSFGSSPIAFATANKLINEVKTEISPTADSVIILNESICRKK